MKGVGSQDFHLLRSPLEKNKTYMPSCDRFPIKPTRTNPNIFLSKSKRSSCSPFDAWGSDPATKIPRKPGVASGSPRRRAERAPATSHPVRGSSKRQPDTVDGCEILHPPKKSFPCKYQQMIVPHCFKVVQDSVHPQ